MNRFFATLFAVVALGAATSCTPNDKTTTTNSTTNNTAAAAELCADTRMTDQMSKSGTPSH